jgi:flavin reductase (DIM6/NTAB) family NADH-FMN oxidoreductase RutF
MTLEPGKIPIAKLHAFLLGSISPRPIALASTIDKNGNPNLSPYSFYNCFGSNPATLVFSPARRVRDNTIKHTLENIYETKEVVINAVNYEMVHQVSLSSVEFPKGISEFTKSGLTPIASEKIKPFRVKESPAQFECIVKDVIETGKEGGAGNLIICEIVLVHINENVLDENGRIDPHKIDLVGRMGNDYYVRASGSAVFEVEKPNSKPAIGYDGIPETIRNSEILSANNLGQLGNIERLPNDEEIESIKQNELVKELLKRFQNDSSSLQYQLHYLAKDYLLENNVIDAWKVLLVK